MALLAPHLQGLEELQGPIPQPTPLGQPTPDPITTGRFDQKTQDITNALMTGSGASLGIGNGETTQPTYQQLPSQNPADLKPFIPEAPPTDIELDTEAFKQGRTKGQDRRADRQARKKQGIEGGFNKRKARRADKQARKQSWADSKI